MLATTRLLVMALLIAYPSGANAAMSFIMNHGAPTCEKYSGDRPKHMSEEEFEYKRLRICDVRWALDGWPPVWLGEEPPHPKKITAKCKDLKNRYYAAMAGRHLLDNYECMPPDKESGLVGCKGFKPSPPPRAEEAAKILEEAVDNNCFFH